MAFGCDHPGGQTCNMLMSWATGRRGAGGRALHISEPCQHSAADGQRVGVSCGVRKAGRRQSFARAGTDVARGRADAKKSRLGPHAGGQLGCAKACCAHEQPGKASERARRAWGCVRSLPFCAGRCGHRAGTSCCENLTERAPNGRSVSSLQLSLTLSHSTCGLQLPFSLSCALSACMCSRPIPTDPPERVRFPFLAHMHPWHDRSHVRTLCVRSCVGNAARNQRIEPLATLAGHHSGTLSTRRDRIRNASTRGKQRSIGR